MGSWKEAIAVMASTDFPEHNAESISAWRTNAEFWDDVQGDEGNHWQRTLVFPSTLELLQPLPGTLLELACGNGNFARAAAALGVEVTATDAAPELIELARRRPDADRIRWRQVDVTDPDQLNSIPGGPFDAAVCNMAIMDIAAISPLFATLPRLLSQDAAFVFSVLHPAWPPGANVRIFRERVETADGQFIEESGVRVLGYLNSGVHHGVAVAGQPQQQPYFDRTLTELFSAAFNHGWVLDGIREPSLADGPNPERKSRLQWADVPQIPPVMVARMRHRGSVMSR